MSLPGAAPATQGSVRPGVRETWVWQDQVRGPQRADTGAMENVRPGLRRLLAAAEVPAYIVGRRVLAWNPLAAAIFGTPPAHRTDRPYGRIRLRHPLAGDLELDYETLRPPADPGLTLVTYTAPAGSPSADRLVLMASWSAGPVPPDLRHQLGL